MAPSCAPRCGEVVACAVPVVPTAGLPSTPSGRPTRKSRTSIALYGESDSFYLTPLYSPFSRLPLRRFHDNKDHAQNVEECRGQLPSLSRPSSREIHQPINVTKTPDQPSSYRSRSPVTYGEKCSRTDPFTRVQ